MAASPIEMQVEATLRSRAGVYGTTTPSIELSNMQGREQRLRMARKYSPSASKDVERAMRRRKKGTLKSGKGGRAGKVKSRAQAIAIGLSEARKKGKKVPKKRASK
jgi:Family of unknown function (DUF6496)